MSIQRNIISLPSPFQLTKVILWCDDRHFIWLVFGINLYM